ncbi:MAG: DUF4870 domain-containing protein [Gemmatimonadota bacterium]|nr:DUF4870 domain-containing protein [Gemmatimonadota bacterium]MDQ6887850.1 DUF4870 domain-containing protein [Gemmatimonadota bacterium]
MTTPPPPSTTGSSSTGLAPNVAGALAYVLGPITGIIFLLLEKENRFVRFHAMQSITVGLILIAVSVVLSILAGVLAIVPIIGWIIGILLSLGVACLSFFLWIYLMWTAFQGREWSAPIAGPLARKYAA